MTGIWKKGAPARIAHSGAAGATLVEIMIGLALSLVVTTSMIGLMSNSMGSATRIIHMSQLTDELRNTMSMLTRDVRRANYNPYSLYCYANADCGVSDSTLRVNAIGDLDTPGFGGNTCLVYFLEREVGDPDDLGDVEGGGFRHVVTDDVGRIEVWVGAGAPPNDCTGDEWTPITDPGMVSITEFTVNDVDGSFIQDIVDDEGTVLVRQRMRQVRIGLQGELLIDDSISRRIEDSIKVRNDFIEVPVS